MTFTLTRKHLTVAGFALTAALFLMADSCSTSPAESATQKTVNGQQALYANHQPLHVYQYSAERATMIQLYDYRTSGHLNTWTVWISNNGVPLGMCASRGFPIPYSTQLTNPLQVARIDTGSGNYVDGVIGQADPNGLFSGNSLGTWVTCIEDDGSLHPQYIEPLVLTFTYPVSITTGKIVRSGAASSDSSLKAKP